jgi:Uma2 family endonuclease
MSYDEFLAWSNDQTFVEWVDGYVRPLGIVTLTHQDILLFLMTLISYHVEADDLGNVLQLPYQMRLNKPNSSRAPDLMFIAKARMGRIGHYYLDGPADLAIEIVSPESVVRDRGEKYAEYEMEGVGEYWIIDPDTNRADFFVLGEDGRYERVHEDPDGIYRSTVLSGYWMNVNWLWQRPMPKLREVLKLWEQA